MLGGGGGCEGAMVREFSLNKNPNVNKKNGGECGGGGG